MRFKINEDLTRKNELLSEKLEELLSAQVYYAKSYKSNEDWEKAIETYRNKRLLTKEMADAFVETIVVHEGGCIEVKLLYDDMLHELKSTIKERSA